MNLSIIAVAAIGTALALAFARARSRRRRRAVVRRCGPACRREAHPEWDSVPSWDPRSVQFPRWLRRTWSGSLAPAETAAVTDETRQRLMLAFTRQLLDDLVSVRRLEPHMARHLMDGVRADIRHSSQHTDTPLL